MIYDYLLVALFAQGFLLSVLLVLKGGRGDRQILIVSGLCFMISYEVFAAFVLPKTQMPLTFLVFLVRENLGFLYPPLVLFLVMNAVHRPIPLQNRIIYLFPFLIYVMLSVISLFFLPLHSVQFNYYVSSAKNILILIALLISLCIARKNKKSLTRDTGSFRHNEVVLVERLLVFSIAAVAFVTVAHFTEPVLPRLSKIVTTVFFCLLGCIIYLLNYFTLLSSVFLKKGGNKHKRDNENGQRYKKDLLSEEDREKYLIKVRKLLEEEKLYLDPDFDMGKLSLLSGLSSNDLSQTINLGTGKNFYSFINEYRLKHACRLIQSGGTKANLLSIAFASGFNSKSAFNKYFKRTYGCPPSRYGKNDFFDSGLN